jgi:hypothetical protein
MEISRRSRQKFADFAAGWGAVRKIEDVYATHGFDLPSNFELPEAGLRRAVCAGAERDIDISDPAVSGRLLRVYADAIDDWGRTNVLWGPQGAEDDPLVDDARALVRSLQNDGAPIDDDAKIVFRGETPPILPVEKYSRLEEPRVLLQQLDRIATGIDRDPPAAIGAAKELTESALKFVLDDYGVDYDPAASLTDLYKHVSVQLRLTRDAVPESAKGSRASHKILQNLTVAVQSLAELRNELGSGHGRTKPSPALARHARLAANSARAVVEFVLETWHARREERVEPSTNAIGA